MSTYIVDTHALVWYFEENPYLSKTVVKILDSENVTLVIPTVVLAEIKYLFSRKKIKVSFQQVVNHVEEDARCKIHPFDFMCVEALDERLNLHDAMIVATGIVYKKYVDSLTKILTKDEKITNIKLVETVW